MAQDPYDVRNLAKLTDAERSRLLSEPGGFERAIAGMQSMGRMGRAELMQLMADYDDTSEDQDCYDADGYIFCAHKQERCNTCCTDHRMSNCIRQLKESGVSGDVVSIAQRKVHSGEYRGRPFKGEATRVPA